MVNIRNLDGQRFGRLIATNTLKKFPNESRRLCYCDCGAETWLATIALTSGNTQSCGCLKHDLHLLPKGQAARNAVLDYYKRTCAKKRGFVWELSDDQFDNLTSRCCVYCKRLPNTTMESRARTNNGDFVYNGIDRVDNTNGYTIENCVTCCKICNRAKGNMTLEEFRAWLRDVSKSA